MSRGGRRGRENRRRERERETEMEIRAEKGMEHERQN